MSLRKGSRALGRFLSPLPSGVPGTGACTLTHFPVHTVGPTRYLCNRRGRKSLCVVSLLFVLLTCPSSAPTHRVQLHKVWAGLVDQLLNTLLGASQTPQRTSQGGSCRADSCLFPYTQLYFHPRCCVLHSQGNTSLPPPAFIDSSLLSLIQFMKVSHPAHSGDLFCAVVLVICSKSLWHSYFLPTH